MKLRYNPEEGFVDVLKDEVGENGPELNLELRSVLSSLSVGIFRIFPNLSIGLSYIDEYSFEEFTGLDILPVLEGL